MNRVNDIINRLFKILSKELHIPESDITSDTQLISDLGLTSFEIIILFNHIEVEFGIEILEEDFKRIICIRDLYDYIIVNISA